MVYGQLAITVDTKKVDLMLTGYQSTLPQGLRLGVKKVAGIYAGAFLRQARLAGIKRFRGQLFNTLQRQIRNPMRFDKNNYGVVMPQQGIYLDMMRPHYVSILPKNRPITLWAEKHGLRHRRGVWVKPHPFISKAHKSARRKIMRTVRREFEKKFRRRGR